MHAAKSQQREQLIFNFLFTSTIILYNTTIKFCTLKFIVAITKGQRRERVGLGLGETFGHLHVHQASPLWSDGYFEKS